MADVVRGRAHKYGDNVDTDAIIPAKYLTRWGPEFLGQHAMEGLDPGFAKSVKPGDVVVAGRNFGCGSSREHAVVALKAAGISAVVAASFARIFYRNAVNGPYRLYPVEVEQSVVDGIESGDELEIDMGRNEVRNLTRGEAHLIKPFPSLVKQIIEAGGLTKYNLARRTAKPG